MPLLSRRGSVAKTDEKITEAFLAFLRSDLWLIPLSEFVEQRSIVFDRDPNLLSGMPDTADTYRAVHKEFKQMVNDLMEAYCNDGQISRDQLIQALKAADQAQKLTSKDRMLLEPLIAAQDFDVFVPMMMRKNIELQLQALKMIEHMNGLLPSSLKLGQEDTEMWNTLLEEEESDRFILISVLKQSREEWERDQRMRDKDWQSQMNAALHESLREKATLKEMRNREQILLEEALQKADNSFKNLTFMSTEDDKVSEKLIGKPIEKSVNFDEAHNMFISPSPSTSRSSATPSGSEAMNIPPETHKTQQSTSITPANANEEPTKVDIPSEKPPAEKLAKKRLSLGQVHAVTQKEIKDKNEAHKGDLAYRALLKDRDGIPEGQLRNRMQYLRDQRDKLLQKKSREREKQLIKAARQSNGERPQTAKAAQDLMEQKAKQIEEERRRIAAKIKAEVIRKDN